MKLLIASDLHREFHYESDDESFVASLADADAIVLAGDIMMARFLDQTRDLFKVFAEKYDHIIYVPGNHEYYMSQPSSVDNLLRVVEQEISQLHILRPETPAVINGQRFIGGTMWFPDGIYNAMRARGLNDFSAIKFFTPWVYAQNMGFRAMLEQELKSTDVVVTHHLPSFRSVHTKYVGDPLNIFFVSDQEQQISQRQPKLWVHGHTHEAVDYKIGETRVIANPHGYPHEEKPFNKALIVEV